MTVTLTVPELAIFAWLLVGAAVFLTTLLLKGADVDNRDALLFVLTTLLWPFALLSELITWIRNRRG